LFHFVTKQLPENAWMTGMSTNESVLPIPKPEEQLWGIYYTDREYAREIGDPLLGIVAAPTKAAAQVAAFNQGLPDSWAHPLSPEQIKSIQGPAKHQPEQARITMQPTTAELRTAIEVLTMLDQRLNDHAAHSVKELPDTELGDRYATHIEAQTTEQTSQIGKVSIQLQNWREELLQQQQQRVAHRV
jgi:hypothetical protein